MFGRDKKGKAPLFDSWKQVKEHRIIKPPFGQKVCTMPLQALLQNRSLFQAIYSGSLWARDNRWLLSRVQRLAGPAGDRGLLSRLEPPTGIKGWPFILVGGSNRDKRLRGPFVPVGATNQDQWLRFYPG